MGLSANVVVHKCVFHYFLCCYLLSIFVNDRGHIKGKSVQGASPQNYTQHTAIPNKQLQKQSNAHTTNKIKLTEN